MKMKFKEITQMFPKKNAVTIKVHPEFRKQLNDFSQKYHSKGIRMSSSKITYLLSKNQNFKRIINKEVKFNV